MTLPVGSFEAVAAHLKDLLDAPECLVLLTRYRTAVSPIAMRQLLADYLARGLLGLNHSSEGFWIVEAEKGVKDPTLYQAVRGEERSIPMALNAAHREARRRNRGER